MQLQPREIEFGRLAHKINAIGLELHKKPNSQEKKEKGNDLETCITKMASSHFTGFISYKVHT